MKIDADGQRFEDSGMGYEAGERAAVITLPADPVEPLRPRRTVSVKLADGKLEFFPERSSSQKRVLQLLGENQ